jgi:hypothetical protein
MTTMVRVLVEGNKACEVKVVDPSGQPGASKTVLPSEFAVFCIHGEQRVEVCEVGEFLST